MNSSLTLEYTVPGDDFTRAGEASGSVKKTLKQLGFPADVIRKVAIALYEGEINMVIHAGGGTLQAMISEDHVDLVVKDEGPGIADISKAMTAGYSTATEQAREMGFGAGMGLPNIKRNSDTFEIESEVGKGTTLRSTVFFNKN